MAGHPAELPIAAGDISQRAIVPEVRSRARHSNSMRYGTEIERTNTERNLMLGIDLIARPRTSGEAARFYGKALCLARLTRL
jgi:hypothetical protein